MYEISLTEHYVDIDNKLYSETTHIEHFIVSGGITDVGDNIKINENQLDNTVLYRPICKYSSRCVSMDIDTTMRIINILDNTTIIKTASLREQSPAKCGKRMLQISLGEPQPNVNVFNRRKDVEIDGDYNLIRINANGGSGGGYNGGSSGGYSNSSDTGVSINGTLDEPGLKIEHHQHSITAFIECANIAVSVENISPNTYDYYYDL